MAISRNEGKLCAATVRVGEKGQIVIPKACRDMFDIKAGDVLLVLGDIDRGIAIVRPDSVEELTRAVFAASDGRIDEEGEA